MIPLKNIVLSLGIAVVLILISCKGPTKVAPNSGAKLENIAKTIEDTAKTVKESSVKVGEGIDKIDEATKAIDTESNNISNTAEAIKSDVEVIKDIVPADVYEKINPKLDNIVQSALLIKQSNQLIKDNLVLIRQEKVKIDESIVRLEKTIDELKNVKKETENLQAKITELEQERDRALQRNLNLLIIGGVLVAAAGVALLFFGNKSAIYLGVGGIALVGVAIAVKNYSEYFALIGLGGLIIVIIGLGIQAYNMYKNKAILAATEKEWDATDRALEEAVETVEAVKHEMDDDKQKEFFGEGALPGKVEVIQSESTRKRIAKHRQRNKHRWEPTVGSTVPGYGTIDDEDTIVEKRKKIRRKKLSI